MYRVVHHRRPLDDSLTLTLTPTLTLTQPQPGDRSTILSIATNPTGFAARTVVGNWVTVGQNCVLKGCTVDDYATI